MEVVTMRMLGFILLICFLTATVSGASAQQPNRGPGAGDWWKVKWYCKNCGYTIGLPHGETPDHDCPKCQKAYDEIPVDRTYSRVLIYGGIAATIGLVGFAIWRIVAQFNREEAEAESVQKKARAIAKYERKKRQQELRDQKRQKRDGDDT